MSPLRRFSPFVSRASNPGKTIARRKTRHRNLRFEALEARTVFSGSPITTLGAATILTTDLPPTSQTGAINGQGVPYGNNYATPYAPQPNVTAYFTSSGLPVQTSDWWSSIMFRTVNQANPSQTGYTATTNQNLQTGSSTINNVTINNLAYAMFADPLIVQVDPSATTAGPLTTFNPRGLAVGYASSFVNTGVTAPGQNTDAIVTSNFNQDLLVGLIDSTASPISSANIAVDNYSDWGATFAWSNGQSGAQAASMTATAANGSPYVFFTTAGGTAIQVSLKPQVGSATLAYLSADSRVAVVLVPNGPGGSFSSSNAYALFAPNGGTWAFAAANGSTPAKLTLNLTGANAMASYFSVAILPQEIIGQTINAANPLLEAFRQHAYAFIVGPAATRDAAHAAALGTQVLDINYNAATSSVVTTMGVTTRLMDTTDATLINGVLLALYPHQFKNLSATGNLTPFLDPSGEQYLYASGKGPMRLFNTVGLGQANAFQTTQFTTEMFYKGIVPYLPNALTGTDAATRDQLIEYVHDVAAGVADTRGFPFPGISENVNFTSIDTNYPGGKHMLRVGLLLPLVDQLLEIASSPTAIAQLTADRLTLLAQLKTALANFFDVGGYEWLAYNDTWDTVIPYPDDNGTATNINDKHFKWGYFLRAAALVARYDADFISPANFGPVLQLIARDAANWERTTSGGYDLPYLRNFNPFAGHSWANGDSVGGNGNNQESSAEAINFAVGLIQLGEAYRQFDAATGDAIREMGIYLFTTETEAIAQYYYNVDQDTYPDNFTLNYATVNLASSITSTQSTVAVTAFPPGFPPGTSDIYRVRVDNETMLVTGRSGNTLTVLRGYDGSAMSQHAGGAGLSLIDPFTSLVGTINSAATSLTVTSAAGFPPAPSNGAAQFRFKIRIDNEIITVVGGAGTTTWTLLRGQDGTTAATHNAGASVVLYAQVAPWGNLTAGVSASATSISVAATPSLAAMPDPSISPYQMEIGGERMLVTARTTATTWTVIRGYGGTIAAAHGTGALFKLVSREFSWTPAETTLTSGTTATASSIDVDDASATFGGFGAIPSVTSSAALSGQLFSFSTTLAADITDTVNQTIDITVHDASSSINSDSAFFIHVGTGGTQSTYFVNNASGTGNKTWNVKRMGTAPYQTHSTGDPVTIVWLSGAAAGDSSLHPTLILDPSSLPQITSALAPFDVTIGSDTYTVQAISATTPNIWITNQPLTSTYSTGTDVYQTIAASATVIGVESTSGFPSNGPFRIMVDNEVMLVQGLYFDTGTSQFLPNVWVVVRGYDGTTAAAHSDPGGVAITLLDPEKTFTIQVGAERMRVLGQTAPGTWTVLRGADGTTATTHNSSDIVTLAEVPPITRVDITGRLFGSGPQKTTFFATPALDREAAFRVIQSLPITGASLYLGQYRNADGTSTIASEARMLAAFEQFLINAQAYPGAVNAGGLYPGTIWGLQALADPAAALANFNAFITDNYAYNVLTGTLLAEPISGSATSFLVAPANLVFPIPPDNNPILTYFKVAFGDASSTDTMLVNQLQLNVGQYNATQFTGTRTGTGIAQAFGQNVVPINFSTVEQGNVTLDAALTWGNGTVTVTDGPDNPFPFVAPVGTQENVAFWVQVSFTVNSTPVTEYWQVNQQTRNANSTRTWNVTRQLVPLSLAVNQAAHTLPVGTQILPVPAFFKFNANSGLDEGESAANTFGIINQLSKLGTPDPGVVAVGASQFAVFKNSSGQRTFAVYNDSAAVLPTVSFYAVNPDGSLGGSPLFTFSNVLARSFYQYSEATTDETIESIPYIDVEATPNQFYLLNTQGNNASNLPNAMSPGSSTDPGGAVTSLVTLPTSGAGNAQFTGGTSFVINNVSGTYNASAGNTKFQLFTLNGSTQTYSNSQPTALDELDAALPAEAVYSAIVRVSYYATGDTGPTAQPFRVELYNQSTFNDPTASSTNNTYDTYTDAVGLKSSTGAFQDMTGGSIKVEVWLWSNNASGSQNVGLKVGTPLEVDPQASRIEIPYLNVSTTGPGIAGTVADQAIADHTIATPFSGVTITNPSNPAATLNVLVEVVNPGDGDFTPHSLLFSGFVEQTPGTGQYTFSGAAAAATAAIRQLEFRATQSMAAVGTVRDIPLRITVSQAGPGGESTTDDTTSLLATNTAPSNAGYIESLFVQLLGRNPDANELANWTNLMNGGLSRVGVLNHFWMSQEHREFQVEDFYHQYLGRASDAWGKVQWVNLLINGASEQDVIAGFLGSAEFRASHPTVAELVEGLYETLLGRAPDSFGDPQWIALLNQGATVDAVVRAFLATPEQIGDRIDGFFETWLGRLPTQFERAFFLDRAVGQDGITAVARLLLLSDEFWNAA